MYKLARPLFFICETSLHAGSGNDLGIVDLPVQRERHTGFPKVEGSGIKGCIREVFEEMAPAISAGKKVFKFAGESISKDDLAKAINLVFGPENGGDHAGALGFTDARLLLFPVKSMKGVFAWVTCPRVLERFKRDMLLCGANCKLEIPPENSIPRNSTLFVKDNKVVLEEYTFEINNKNDDCCTVIANWLSKNVIPSGEAHKYWREKMARDIVVIPDDDFRDFVSLSTEVVTRTKIDSSTGTVAKGQLFTEEYLPPETVLYSLALATPLFSDDKGIFKTGENGAKADKSEEEKILESFLADNLPQVIQIGGNATIGKGLAWVNMDVELSQGGAENE